jgi:hypothetical protein
MPKPVILTPAQIEAGVKKNVNEYTARVAALRALDEQKAYNPVMSAEELSKLASEAGRGAQLLPALTPSRNNEFDVRLAAPDKQAEAEAKSKGGRRVQAKHKESEEGEGQEGDGGVQERNPAFGQQARPQGSFAQAGHSDSPSPVWIERTYEGKTKEEVSEMIPADAKAVTYVRIWKATALVRQG